MPCATVGRKHKYFEYEDFSVGGNSLSNFNFPPFKITEICRLYNPIKILGDFLKKLLVNLYL